MVKGGIFVVFFLYPFFSKTTISSLEAPTNKQEFLLLNTNPIITKCNLYKVKEKKKTVCKTSSSICVMSKRQVGKKRKKNVSKRKEGLDIIIKKEKKKNHGYVAVPGKKNNCYDNDDRQVRTLLIDEIVYASFFCRNKKKPFFVITYQGSFYFLCVYISSKLHIPGGYPLPAPPFPPFGP